jgi:MSHA pilin protein MshA
MNRSAQRGFTLIELVVVIVILGILAAFAVPRFANLDRQARISSVRALEGSLRASSTMAHSMWRAQGQVGNVNMEGQGIVMVNGFPNLATIDNTLAPNTIQAGVAGRWAYAPATGVFTLNGATTPASCSVTYAQATVVNGVIVPPVIQVPAVATLNANC